MNRRATCLAARFGLSAALILSCGGDGGSSDAPAGTTSTGTNAGGSDAGSCEPLSCATLGAECGIASDGCGHALECGADCPTEQFCGGGGPNRCGAEACSPAMCSPLGTSCGMLSDGCSDVMDCGECRSGGPGFLWGIGEQLVYNATAPAYGWNLDAQVDHLLDLSPEVVRMWMLCESIFSGFDAESSKPIVHAEHVALYDDVIQRLKAAGVIIVGMNNRFPPWMTGGDADTMGRVPCRSSQAAYQEFTRRYSTSWREMVALFPDIRVWETGNEPNLPTTIRPLASFPCQATETEGDGGEFTQEERAAIATELMFYAREAVRSVQPEAFVFMPSLARQNLSTSDFGMVPFLELIYENILASPLSTDPRDYFDGANWHPYLRHGVRPDDDWVHENVKVHQVLEEHGDGQIPVFFSELGFNDATGHGADVTANAEWDTHADWMVEAVHLAEQNFPWLWATTWFRLVDDPILQSEAYPDGNYRGVMRSPDHGFVWKSSAFTFESFATSYPLPPGLTRSFEFDDLNQFVGTGLATVAPNQLRAAGGLLYGTPAAGDYWLTSPVLNTPTAEVQEIEVKMKVFPNSTTARLYFTTDTGPNWGENQSIWFPVEPDGKPHVYKLRPTDPAYWDDLSNTWHGKLLHIRLVPSDQQHSFVVDYIRFR